MTVKSITIENATNIDNMTEISFRDVEISNIPHEFQGIYSKVTKFTVERAKLKEIHQNDFSQFPELKVLWLYENDLEVLENNLFERNLHLEEIDLHNNKIWFIDDETFKNLNSLESLNLKGNLCVDFHFKGILPKKSLLNETCVEIFREPKNENSTNIEDIQKDIQKLEENLNNKIITFFIISVVISIIFMIITFFIIKCSKIQNDQEKSKNSSTRQKFNHVQFVNPSNDRNQIQIINDGYEQPIFRVNSDQDYEEIKDISTSEFKFYFIKNYFKKLKVLNNFRL